MANRHLSRSIVLQTLFEWDFLSKDSKEITGIFKRNVTEFAPGHGDFSFMEKLLDGILEKQKDIDLIIEKEGLGLKGQSPSIFNKFLL